MRVGISPHAERDLEAIGDCIANDNPQRSLRFVKELCALCTNIAKMSHVYRARPELGIGVRARTHVIQSINNRQMLIHVTLHRCNFIGTAISA